MPDWLIVKRPSGEFIILAISIFIVAFSIFYFIPQGKWICNEWKSDNITIHRSLLENWDTLRFAYETRNSYLNITKLEDYEGQIVIVIQGETSNIVNLTENNCLRRVFIQ